MKAKPFVRLVTVADRRGLEGESFAFWNVALGPTLVGSFYLEGEAKRHLDLVRRFVRAGAEVAVDNLDVVLMTKRSKLVLTTWSSHEAACKSAGRVANALDRYRESSKDTAP